jgi:hypothetical protein
VRAAREHAEAGAHHARDGLVTGPR